MEANVCVLCSSLSCRLQSKADCNGLACKIQYCTVTVVSRVGRLYCYVYERVFINMENQKTDVSSWPVGKEPNADWKRVDPLLKNMR